MNAKVPSTSARGSTTANLCSVSTTRIFTRSPLVANRVSGFRAVDDAFGVCRRQSVVDLLGVLHRVAWCYGALLQLGTQTFAFEQGQSFG